VGDSRREGRDVEGKNADKTGYEHKEEDQGSKERHIIEEAGGALALTSILVFGCFCSLNMVPA